MKAIRKEARWALSAILVACASLVVPGCGLLEAEPPEVGATLRADRGSYAVGDTLRLTFTNVGTQSLHGSSCPFLVEQLTDEGWVTVEYRQDCPFYGAVFAPGRSVHGSFPLVPDLITPGTYRGVARWHVGTSEEQWNRTISETFLIHAPQ